MAPCTGRQPYPSARRQTVHRSSSIACRSVSEPTSPRRRTRVPQPNAISMTPSRCARPGRPPSGAIATGTHFQHNGRQQRAYYSANVFSQTLPNGRVNGIPAFDVSWKDVVGTLYHELNEFRTDADVRDAIETGNDDGVLGWMGARGEIGDQPIAMAGAVGNLSLVFQESLSSAGGGRLPVQFLYSNAVHGGEGPIDRPDPPAQT